MNGGGMNGRWNHWWIYTVGMFLSLFVFLEFTLSLVFYSTISPSAFMFYFTPVGFFLGESLGSLFFTALLFIGFLLILLGRVYVKNEHCLKFDLNSSHLLLPFYLISISSMGIYISLITFELSNVITYAVFILLFESFVEHVNVSNYGEWIRGLLREEKTYIQPLATEDSPEIEDEIVEELPSVAHPIKKKIPRTELPECPICGFKETMGATICSECGEPLVTETTVPTEETYHDVILELETDRFEEMEKVPEKVSIATDDDLEIELDMISELEDDLDQELDSESDMDEDMDMDFEEELDQELDSESDMDEDTDMDFEVELDQELDSESDMDEDTDMDFEEELEKIDSTVDTPPDADTDDPATYLIVALGISEEHSKLLVKNGISAPIDIVNKGLSGLAAMPQLDFINATRILNAAREYIASKEEPDGYPKNCPLCEAEIPNNIRECPQCGEPLNGNDGEDEDFFAV